MGCGNSKLDSEDTVSRCRERRRLMKQAVKSRHLFTAAHSDYLHHLRMTGNALTHFSSGESLAVSDAAPPLFIHRSLSSVSSALPPTKSHSFHHYHHSLTKPSPPGKPTPQSTFSASSPTHSLASDLTANSEAPAKQSQDRNVGGKPIRATSFAESPTRSVTESCRSSTYRFAGKPQFSEKLNSVHASNMSPSQSSSSIWNWENLYPPSPPGSDFYRRRDEHKTGNQDDEHDSVSREREEVQCSDWGDGYCCTTSGSSSEDEDDAQGGHENGDSRSESWVPAESVADKFSRRSDIEGVTGLSDRVGDLKLVRRHKDLSEIAAALEECFVKAAEAGKEVAEFLETDREYLDRNFRQLTKKVYHSNNLFTNLSSTWTSKPPLAIKYSMKTGALTETAGRKSHCSTLEQLLAWERKLYDEVKAREAAKIEHEKKLHSLQTQEYRGENEVKLDKTKAAIKKLQSLIMVASQAVNTTSSAITTVRDTELGPQLIDLCRGLMRMWKSMHNFHEIQNDVVQQVRGLINQSAAGDSTSELHRQSTHHLQIAVSGWHSSFFRLIKHHRDYIHSLNSWLRLTLYCLDDLSEDAPATTTATAVASHISSLCEEWRHAMDRLPDTVASEAIKGFATVVQAIALQQSDELRCQKRSETAAKELEKKAASLRAVEKKFYGAVSSYSFAGIDIPGSGSDPAAIDARDPLAEKRLAVVACRRRAEEERLKHTKSVQVTRAMTLNNIQAGLPGVFQAMTAFSNVCGETFETVCTHTRVVL